MHPERICGAKTRTGDLCTTAPMPNGRCRMHGGASLAGTASRTFKSGKYSRYVPERLIDRYEEAANDDELLGLSDEVALVDARLLDLLDRVDTGESGALWKQLHKLWKAYQAEEDTDRGNDLIMQIGQTITAGATDYAAWSEVNKQLNQRKTLVESERKRLVELRQNITAEKAMVLIASLAEIIQRHVIEPHVRNAIAADLARLTHQHVGRELNDGS